MAARGQRHVDASGAISAEYTAAVVVIAALVAALFSSGIPQKVSAHARFASCSLFGGECELEEVPVVAGSDPSDPSSATGPDEGDHGPEIAPEVLPDGPIDLGPGSAGGAGSSVTVTTTEELTDHLEVQTSLTASESRTNLDLDGCERRTLGVELSTQIKASADATTRRRLQLGAEAFTGASSAVNVTVTPAHAERIRSDPRDAPNPFQPLDMPVGSAVEFTSETFAGYGLNAAYRLLRASVEETAGHEVSLGVIRLEDDTLRLVVGEADLVRRALALGIGTDEFHVMVGNTTYRRDAELRTVDIDVASSDGYETYLSALSTGRWPEADAPGVRDRAHVEVFESGGAHVASARLGSLGGTLEGASSDMSFETTTYDDGRYVETHSARYDDLTVVIEHEYASASSNDPIGESYTMLLQSVPHDSYRLLQGVRGEPVGELDGNLNLRIDLTAQDLLELRDQARIGAEYLDAHEGSTLARLAAAEDHLGVLDVFLQFDMANPGSVIEDGLVRVANTYRMATDDPRDTLDIAGDIQRLGACD